MSYNWTCESVGGLTEVAVSAAGAGCDAVVLRRAVPADDGDGWLPLRLPHGRRDVVNELARGPRRPQHRPPRPLLLPPRCFHAPRDARICGRCDAVHVQDCAPPGATAAHRRPAEPRRLAAAATARRTYAQPPPPPRPLLAPLVRPCVLSRGVFEVWPANPHSLRGVVRMCTGLALLGGVQIHAGRLRAPLPALQASCLNRAAPGPACEEWPARRFALVMHLSDVLRLV